jgi:hypothetical protein
MVRRVRPTPLVLGLVGFGGAVSASVDQEINLPDRSELQSSNCPAASFLRCLCMASPGGCATFSQAETVMFERKDG